MAGTLAGVGEPSGGIGCGEDQLLKPMLGPPHAGCDAMEATDDARGWWRLVWCHERCYKLENDTLRQEIVSVVQSYGASLVCLKKARRFGLWMERTAGPWYVLVTDWREAQPCMHAILQSSGSKPLQTVVLCSSQKQYRRAQEWAASLVDDAGIVHVCEVDDIPETLLAGVIRRCFGQEPGSQEGSGLLHPPNPQSPLILQRRLAEELIVRSAVAAGQACGSGAAVLGEAMLPGWSTMGGGQLGGAEQPQDMASTSAAPSSSSSTTAPSHAEVAATRFHNTLRAAGPPHAGSRDVRLGIFPAGCLGRHQVLAAVAPPPPGDRMTAHPPGSTQGATRPVAGWAAGAASSTSHRSPAQPGGSPIAMLPPSRFFGAAEMALDDGGAAQPTSLTSVAWGPSAAAAGGVASARGLGAVGSSLAPGSGHSYDPWSEFGDEQAHAAVQVFPPPPASDGAYCAAAAADGAPALPWRGGGLGGPGVGAAFGADTPAVHACEALWRQASVVPMGAALGQPMSF